MNENDKEKDNGPSEKNAGHLDTVREIVKETFATMKGISRIKDDVPRDNWRDTLTLKLRDQDILFSVATGTVLEVQKHSSTSVHSSGGGGYVHEGSGYISAPTVHSTTSTTQEIWFKDASGTQHQMKFFDADVPIRTGNEFSIVYAGVVGQYYPSPMALVNYATNHWHYLSAPADFLAKIGIKTKYKRKSVKAWCLYLLAFFACVPTFPVLWSIPANVGTMLHPEKFRDFPRVFAERGLSPRTVMLGVIGLELLLVFGCGYFVYRAVSWNKRELKLEEDFEAGMKKLEDDFIARLMLIVATLSRRKECR